MRPANAAADLPRYDPGQNYAWNYDNAPDPVAVPVPRCPGAWTFCGRPVPSPLGMPAGPLLNGRWILYYAALGFDVLTYKTVRSVERACLPMPNLQPVDVGPLRGGEREVPASAAMHGTWAVAFGMPSMSPETWRRDVAWTRDRLAAEKLLCVSVVGTVQPGWTLRDLADDYACCARWAVDSGADAVEMNFSCPNVCTVDGQLYQQPRDAALVAEHVRGSVGGVPLLAKIGHVTDPEAADRLLAALAPHVAGLSMTNSVAATVRAPDGGLLFAGEPRGLCGDATRAASVAQTRLFREAGVRLGRCPALIGVGGASRAEHVHEYLAAGAECVHVATAAMTDPLVACRIRAAFAESA